MAIKLTRRVNDFETVYLERKHEKCASAITVDNFNGEKKLQSHSKYLDVLHGSILLSPFFVPS